MKKNYGKMNIFESIIKVKYIILSYFIFISLEIQT